MSKPTSKDISKLTPEQQMMQTLIDQSERHGFLSSGFDFETFFAKCEHHGLVGAEQWTDEMLRMVMDRLTQQATSDELDEEKIDSTLSVFSQKINIDLNRIRRAYWNVPDLKVEGR